MAVIPAWRDLPTRARRRLGYACPTDFLSIAVVIDNDLIAGCHVLDEKSDALIDARLKISEWVVIVTH